MAGHIRRIHEYTVDRPGDGQPGVAKIVSVNPLKRFVSGSHPPIVWQDHKWMDDGGRYMDEDAVPAYCKEHVAAYLEQRRPGRSDEPELLMRCDFCQRYDIPSSQYAKHLIDDHVPQAPAAPIESAPPIPPEKPAPFGRRGKTVVHTAARE